MAEEEFFEVPAAAEPVAEVPATEPVAEVPVADSPLADTPDTQSAAPDTPVTVSPTTPAVRPMSIAERRRAALAAGEHAVDGHKVTGVAQGVKVLPRTVAMADGKVVPMPDEDQPKSVLAVE